jgi:Holliday junction resolvase RusA-like endonuclease
MIEFDVYGMPGPQGSKRHVGGGRMIESSAKVKPWREDVRAACLMVMFDLLRDGFQSQPLVDGPLYPLDCPLRVRMIFTLPKPASAPKRRQTWPMRTPDLSKLVRSTEDAITSAGLWKDDARVVELVAAKRYPNEGEDSLASPGCRICIEPLA